MKKWNEDTIQSPLARARGYGSAQEGSKHWFHQRVTAIANIPLVLWLIYSILKLQGADYTTFTTWLAHPINAVLMILFILSIFYHAVLGSQVVIEDYVHTEWFKLAKLIGIKLFFTAASIACIFSVLKVAL